MTWLVFLGGWFLVGVLAWLAFTRFGFRFALRHEPVNSCEVERTTTATLAGAVGHPSVSVHEAASRRLELGDTL